MDNLHDERFMRMALIEAEKASEDDEVPVGAIITWKSKVLSKAYNQVERLKDPTAHAEIIAITTACNELQSKFLPECTLYVTLEPCLMCAGAIDLARLSRVVFAASDPKFGYQRIKEYPFKNKIQIDSGVLQNEASRILTDFFRTKRD